MKRVALIYIILAQLFGCPPVDAGTVIQSKRQLSGSAHEIISSSFRHDTPVDLSGNSFLNSIVHKANQQRTPVDLIKGDSIGTNTNGWAISFSVTYNSTPCLLYIRSLLFPKHFFW